MSRWRSLSIAIVSGLMAAWIPAVFGQDLQPQSADGPLGSTEAATADRDLNLGPNNNRPSDDGEAGDWRDPAEFIRAHWVRLTPNRQLVGQIQTVADNDRLTRPVDMTVEIYRDGQSKGKANVVDGRFTLVGTDPGGLTPGVYSMIARGDDGFLAYGLQLLPPLEADNPLGMRAVDKATQLVQAIEARGMLEIRSTAVPPTFKQLKRILEQNYPKMRQKFVPETAFQPFLEEAIANEEPGFDEETGPHSMRGTEELSSDETPGDDTVGATTITMQPVFLDENNRMLGRLYGIDAKTGRPQKVNKTTVFVLKNDRQITTAEVDERGFFSLSLRRPDIYSLVAAGEDGFGAVSFRAVGIDEQDREARRYRRQWDDYIQLAQLDPFDQDNGVPGFGAPPAGNPAGGNAMAAPFAMALISDPCVIRQATSHWAAPQLAMGGMMDAGLAAPAPPAPGGFPGGQGGFGPSGGFSGGGGGGFFGGGAGLIAGGLGLAGLAGLASDNDDPLVSPFTTNFVSPVMMEEPTTPTMEVEPEMESPVFDQPNEFDEDYLPEEAL